MIEINGQEYNSKAEFEEVMLASHTMELNIQHRAYLTSTDWYVVRLTETGVPVPADILLKRQEARDAITGET
jgi:hypothetical protein